jgi:hypothetical protein
MALPSKYHCFVVDIVTGWLKARIVEQEEAAIARQWQVNTFSPLQDYNKDQQQQVL